MATFTGITVKQQAQLGSLSIGTGVNPISNLEQIVSLSTFTFDGSGGTSSNITMTLIKVGSFVHIYIPKVTATSGTSSTVLASNVALPASWRPTSTQTSPLIGITNNNIITPSSAGIVQITTGGIVNIYRDVQLTTTFTNASTCGMGFNTLFTYSLV